MSKLFTVAGVSFFKGEYKVRFANDLTRVSALEKCGNTEVTLVQLPEEMDKNQAAEYIATLPDFTSNTNYKLALDEFLTVEVKEPKAKKEPKEPKAKKVPAGMNEFEVEALAQAAARAKESAEELEDENVPF